MPPTTAATHPPSAPRGPHRSQPGRPARSGIALGPIGFRWRTGVLVLVVLLVTAIVAVAVHSLLFGRLDYSPAVVWDTLTGGGTTLQRLVIVDQRFSQVAAAVLVGAALGMAGALTQSITRNPIASPDILGVTNGAAAVAVTIITNPALVTVIGIGSLSTTLTVAALVGGLLTTALILSLSWRGGFDGTRLILVGLGVNAVAVAMVSWQLTRADDDVEASIALRWLTGSLSKVGTDLLAVVAIVTLLGFLACVVLARGLAAVRLGREVAVGLGVSAGRIEAAALLVAVILTSTATAVAGPIPFVAFVAAQGALRIFRTAGPPPVLGGITGATVLLIADWIAARLPITLPIGVVTSIMGAPVLLLLLTRRWKGIAR